MSEKIVGHKTFSNGDGTYRHEPITESEADAIIKKIDESKARRAEAMPTAEDAARAMFEAWYRLKELGFRDPRYAPADDRQKKCVQLGSSGIHEVRCTTNPAGGKWWWHDSEGDTWPYDPALYLPDEQEAAEEQERLALAAAARRGP